MCSGKLWQIKCYIYIIISKVLIFGPTEFSTIWKKKRWVATRGIWQLRTSTQQLLQFFRSSSKCRGKKCFWLNNTTQPLFAQILINFDGHITYIKYTLKELKPQVKRARDYLRFGKREVIGTEGVGENDYIENEEFNFPVKRYGRRRISNFLRFGWFHLNLK